MKQQLYEVWGDTVDSRHLGYSILIGAVVSLGAFFIAQHFLLSWVASAQMARAYAMLVGILGCLGAGMISASLFKPKRIVVEHQADPAQRAQLLQELKEEFGDLGRLADLPAATLAELKEMDLYELFAAEERAAPEAADSAPASHPPALGTAVLTAKGGRP